MGYINIGVAEQNLISVAAGLALGGKRVYVYGLASFITQRCFEQIRIDLSGLPVMIIGSGPGLSYNSDGPTHHAIEDVALMRTISGMTIFSLSDSTMAKSIAQMDFKTPIYVRLDRGEFPVIYKNNDFSEGFSVLKKGKTLIISTGVMVHQALKLNVGVIDLYRLKPINKNLIPLINQAKKVITLEEHSIIGGIGSIISEIITDNNLKTPLKRLALPEKCTKYGTREQMRKYCGL